jgi:hypothetical protein
MMRRTPQLDCPSEEPMTRVLLCTTALLACCSALGRAEAPSDVSLAIARARTASEDAPENAVPDEVLTILREGEPLELVSLHHDDLYEFQEGDEKLIHWKVLGRTTIDEDDTRRRLIAALERGVAKHDGSVARCFWPRHAFSTTYDGHRYDILVCFQCYQVEVYRDGEKDEALSFLIGKSPQRVFDRVLKDADVPLDSGEE